MILFGVLTIVAIAGIVVLVFLVPVTKTVSNEVLQLCDHDMCVPTLSSTVQ